MRILITKMIQPISAFFFGILVVTSVTNIFAHDDDASLISLIHGCVKTSNGSLKVIAANERCGQGETSLDWRSNLENYHLPRWN